MSDASGSNTVQALVDQLALTSTLCDVTDLGELAKMHSQVSELLHRVENASDFGDTSQFSVFGAALASMLEGIVLEAYPDLEATLETVREAISEIQKALKADPTRAPVPSDNAFLQKVLSYGDGDEESASEEDAASAPKDCDEDESEDPSGPLAATEQEPEDSPASDPSSVEEEEYVSEPLHINHDELEYVQSFNTEAQEHIEAIEAAVLQLEQDLSDTQKVNELFRPFHTIKGMAGFLNLADIQALTHKGETLLDLARKGQLTLTNDHIDLILDTLDILKEQVEAVAEYCTNPTGEVVPQPDITQALAALQAAIDSKMIQPISRGKDAQPSPGETEQTLPNENDAPSETAPDAPGQMEERRSGTDRRSGVDRRGGQKKDLTVRLETSKLDHLVNMVGELVIAQAMVSQHPLLGKSQKLTKDVSQVTKITREVQEITMAMRMVTLHQTFQKMARLARDVSRKAGKKVTFTISGEDTELDKNVIDEIGDPLMHMVRNSVDHGIELPEERLAAGKDETGTVHLHAAHEGGNIVIEITDDGRGLDRDKLITKGIERALITAEDQLSDQEVFALIMQAGFSTAEKVTDISGRGVGMDVVKRNIEKLRGKVEINSEKGKGSKFTIRLPLTLAIIDGMVVTVGEERFIIPTIAIDQSLRPEKEQVTTVQQRGEMLMVRGQLCPLIRLEEHFGIPVEPKPVWERMVVIAIVDGKRIGIVLDDLIGQQQIVIKSLGNRFEQVKGISGGAILGDGKVGLILDAPSLLEMHNGQRA